LPPTAGTAAPPATPAAAALAPVAGTFATLGMFWGTWAVAIANVQRAFGLSDATLGVLLAVAIAVAGLTGAVAGHRAERWGTRRMLVGALALWAVLLVAAGVAPTWPLFAVAFIACEVAAGCVDTAMNAASAAELGGRPSALVRFHAFFNMGAVAGALVAGLLLRAGLSWRVLWPALAIVVAGVALWTRRTPGPAGRPVPPGPVGDGSVAVPSVGDGSVAVRAPGPIARLRGDRLGMFLVIFAVAEVVEGGVDTWGVLYLRTWLAAGVLVGAGAYALGQSLAATTRGAGGGVLGRLSPRRALLVGAVVAGIGILVESTSPVVGVAAAGLALGAAGASLFWPLVMSDVSRRATLSTSAVGAFTAAGYVGWVAGAPVVGWVSDTFGAARGLQLLAAMAALVALSSLVRGDS